MSEVNSLINLPDHIDVTIEDRKKVNQYNVPLYCKDDLDSVLIPNGQINDRISKLASDIVDDLYKEGGIFSKSDLNKTDELLCICVLKGGEAIFNNLCRKISKITIAKQKNMKITYEFIKIKSYKGQKSTGEITIEGLNIKNIKNKNILIIEDIVDSGVSAFALTEYLSSLQPKTMKFLTLLIKKIPRKKEFRPDYIGFAIPDAFVVGFALDLDESFRDLDHICILKDGMHIKYLKSSD